MLVKIRPFKDKIFILAILGSVIWHLFWISTVTVVVVPKKTTPIKFSKVSFLGQMMEMGAIEARIIPKERSFLEERYLSKIREASASSKNLEIRLTGSPDATNKDCDKRLLHLIEEGLRGSKLEPPNDYFILTH